MTKWTGCSTFSRRVLAGARARSTLALAFVAALCCASSASAIAAPWVGDPESLFTGPGSGGSSGVTGGAVLAIVELEAPTQQQFVLRATLPVPPNTFPRKDGLLPLALRNSDGFVVPTQMQAVSWYAAERDGADVVEVLARVDRPHGATVGQRVSYRVVQHLHPNGPLPLEQYLVDFLLQPGKAMLVATDVFGNRYQVDLLKPIGSPAKQPRVEVLRAGEGAVQFRTYNVMRPLGSAQGPPTGALPHFFGVHAYVTAWAKTRALTLDLRVHNGFDGFDKLDHDDDPLGKIYFRDLELWLPNDWTVVPEVQDVQAGSPYLSGEWTRYPLVKPLASGKMHVFPHQFQMERRLAIARKVDYTAARAVVQDEGLAFCRRGAAPSGGQLWSWWNPKTARYFPQRHQLPDLSFLSYTELENQLAGMYSMAHKALETGNPGNYAVPSTALGWAHPWGIPYGGMTGGIEINLYEGVQLAEVATHEGWLSMRLTHRMSLDRQGNALYSRSGDPTRLEKWVEYSSFPFVDMNFWMTLVNGPDPFGFKDAPTYQVQHVEQAGLKPGYEGALLDYMPYDFQHHVRFTRTPKVLAWLGNDALAKDDLAHAAEIVRMSMHEYPNPDGKYHTGAVLFALKAHIANHPGKGISWGRGESWSLDTVVAAYALGDASFRARALPWLETCADIVAQAQVPCSGFIQAADMPQWLGGVYRTRSQPEHTITENALWGLTKTVFQGADPGREKQTEHVVGQAASTVIGPIAWSDTMKSPWFLAATAPLDLSKPAYCTSPPPNGVGSGGEAFFSWASFGYAFEVTRNPELLQKMALMGGKSTALSALLAKLANENCNIETISAVLATLQSL
jgi:hypothetical protein